MPNLPEMSPIYKMYSFSLQGVCTCSGKQKRIKSSDFCIVFGVSSDSENADVLTEAGVVTLPARFSGGLCRVRTAVGWLSQLTSGGMLMLTELTSDGHRHRAAG